MSKSRSRDELLKEMSWAVISGITSGRRLESIMSEVFDLVIFWQREKKEHTHE